MDPLNNKRVLVAASVACAVAAWYVRVVHLHDEVCEHAITLTLPSEQRGHVEVSLVNKQVCCQHACACARSCEVTDMFCMRVQSWFQKEEASSGAQTNARDRRNEGTRTRTHACCMPFFLLFPPLLLASCTLPSIFFVSFLSSHSLPLELLSVASR